MEELKMTSIYLPRDMIIKIKKKAADLEISSSEYIRRAVRRELENTEKKND
jgi:Arc/MetJ-type ribon-helix-helix transcriptional regulator